MQIENVIEHLERLDQKIENISERLLKLDNDINELKVIIQKRKTKLWQLVGLSFALILFSSLLSLV